MGRVRADAAPPGEAAARPPSGFRLNLPCTPGGRLTSRFSRLAFAPVKRPPGAPV